VEQAFFNLGRVHFFSGDIDQVGDAPNNFETETVTREQIVRNENAIA